jgi:hypothetical protein
MSTANAVLAYDVANQALRFWGACDEVVALYRRAAGMLAAAEQSYLAGIAIQRAYDVESLV